VWLSQFPIPPISVPTMPISPGFSIPAVGGNPSSVYNTLQARQSTAPLVGGSRSHSNLTAAHESFAYSPPSGSPHQPSSSHAPSPHDWHDGASSVTLDTTEDRLLRTSFITSLLQENVASRFAERTSPTGDASSGFSEVSYPPLTSGFGGTRVQFSPSNTSVLRQPGWRHPSDFTPILESPNGLSRDSESSRSNQDYSVKAARFSDVPHLEGGSAVHATHAVPPPSAEKRLDRYPQGVVDPYKDALLSASFGSPLGTTLDDSPVERSQTAQGRESIHSTRSMVPSWISRLSASRSVRRVMAWRIVRPLPPVPILHNIATVESDGRGDELESPDTVNRRGIVNHGHHPHRRRSSRFVAPNKEEPNSAFDDSSYVDRGLTSLQPKRSPKPQRRFGNQRLWSLSAPVIKGNLLALHKKRIFVVVGVIFLLALAAVGTTLGIVTRRGKAPLVCSTGLAGAGCDLSQSFSLTFLEAF
jgi:hypothetical protein